MWNEWKKTKEFYTGIPRNKSNMCYYREFMQ